MTRVRVRGKFVSGEGYGGYNWTCPGCKVDTLDSTGEDIQGFWNVDRERQCFGCGLQVLVEANHSN